VLATQSPERSPLNIGVDVRKRSAERTEFLNDILCTFAEGGIQMIGEIVNKEFDADALEYRWLIVRYFDSFTNHHVDIETIAKAFGRLKPYLENKISPEYKSRMNKLYREFDAGEIDAVDATNLVEIGLFGEIVYG
jgi:hypothetical protein